MKDDLREALGIVEAICADATGEFPAGLLRVRRLLKEVLAECWDDGDVAVLAEGPPAPAA